MLPCLVLAKCTAELSANIDNPYKVAVTLAIMLGGCNASRASLVGAVVAASTKEVPVDWIDKCLLGSEIETCAKSIVGRPL